MSLKHKDYIEYWDDVGPRLEKYLQSQHNNDVINVLNTCIGYFSYVTEDMGQKVQQNKKLSPKLDLFMVFAHDQLRGALPLYLNLNLAPTANSARCSFENWINLKYIFESGFPFMFADRYNRYSEILRLKAHRNSTVLPKLTPEEEKSIISKNPDWIDPFTGKLSKKPHWTAMHGINLEIMTKKLGISEYYSVYRSTSQFTHASSITGNLYRNGQNSMGAIGIETQCRRMALLVAIFTMDTLNDFCLFFDISIDKKQFMGILKELQRLS